jgi:ornithine cyclodeaminase/alanine dehydrogenase
MSAELGIDVQSTEDLGWAARQSDVIVTCTPSNCWFLGREHVSPGTFVAAVGADSPQKQEIEPELLAAASVVCDLVGQCAHVGDLHHAVAAGLMQTSQVRGELADVITAKVPGRRDNAEIIVFDSTGTALQDTAAAALIYERALQRPNTQRFSFWR